MTNSEQHEMLCGILTKLVPVLDCDELSLLAHSCGIKVSEFYGTPEETIEILDVIEWRTAA